MSHAAEFRLPIARALVLLLCMVIALGLAAVLRPTKKTADEGPKVDLETMIPKQFGDWRGLPTMGVIIANPQALENLERIYTKTLTRTYTDARGRQIMLSIAYGANQRDGMNLHYPEVCYPAQGFQTISKRTAQLSTPFGLIRAKRLEMVLGQRYEPVTYWTMVGDRATLTDMEKKLNEIYYALKGVIPDGLLFRVSSITRSTDNAFRDHEEFVGKLLVAMTPESRKRLSGL